MRWQIELEFKRLKSLAQLGHVPKHDDRSSRAWLYGKLLLTLLAKIDSHRARYFPLGLPTLGARGHIVRRVNLVSRFTRSSRPSNRTSPSSKRFIRGIRLHRLLQKSRAIDYSNWRNGVPTKQLTRRVHDLYFNPQHEEFEPRTTWSLSNAFTSAFKNGTRFRSLKPLRSWAASWRRGSQGRSSVWGGMGRPLLCLIH